MLTDLEAVCDLEKDYVVIKLHGFFQTDDRIAIQEITRQVTFFELSDAAFSQIFFSHLQSYVFIYCTL